MVASSRHPDAQGRHRAVLSRCDGANRRCPRDPVASSRRVLSRLCDDHGRRRAIWVSSFRRVGAGRAANAVGRHLKDVRKSDLNYDLDPVAGRTIGARVDDGEYTKDIEQRAATRTATYNVK